MDPRVAAVPVQRGVLPALFIWLAGLLLLVLASGTGPGLDAVLAEVLRAGGVPEPAPRSQLLSGVFLGLVGLYLVFVLPRLRLWLGLLLSGLGLLLLFGLLIGGLRAWGLVLPVGAAAVLLFLGQGTFLLAAQLGRAGWPRAVDGKDGRPDGRAVQGAADRPRSAADSARLMALAFQRQGQLDMALEKFRQSEVDATWLEQMYQLGLDFEQRLQGQKAAQVFAELARHDADFRDVLQRLARLARSGHAAVVAPAPAVPGEAPAAVGSGTATPVLQLPVLGRYQVEKPLGKGAMGAVYLGRDPRINRVVAIKTMALAQEFDGKELDDAKARFFREAETAGRLNHPHIVTIFDVGEADGLAYIAMEYLRGQDLLPYTQPEQRLPLERVMEIGARVAEALDYAHQHQVVHRDVKPANIMYEPAADLVKVMDFGIARITDSTKTKTGMVLGTPSYMSPEQLAGRKIDGRSDLYSLGVTLYQLVAGRLPFRGESMAQLMYNIAHAPPPPLLPFNDHIPPCLEALIEQALQKDPARRPASGAAMARALRACLAQLPGASSS